MEPFEEIQIYENERRNEIENFSPIFILVDGVFDINFFSDEIRAFYSSNYTITEITNGLILLSFETNTTLFINSIKVKLEILHYKTYSIFIKKSQISNIINEFRNININLFYLYFEFNSEIILSKIKAQNAKYFKHSSKSPNKLLYGFNTYSDLIDFYIKLIKEKSIWPIFTFLPTQIISLQKNETNKNLQSLDVSKSYYHIFCPLKILNYFCFIEKFPKRPQRKMNVDELFEIKNIPDVQISHLYKKYENSFLGEQVIGTFLGFENVFRCLHVFDYFVRMKKKTNDSIIDVFLIDKIEYPINCIKYDMFYIEMKSFLDCSLMYSINNLDSFNLKNDFSDEFSSFYSFDNKNDFDNAKKLMKSNIKNNDFVFKDLNLIDANELSILFPKQKKSIQSNENLFFLIFRLKIYNKENKINLTSLLKTSVMMIKDENCSLNGKLYIIAGFNDDTNREETYQLLKKSKYSYQIKSYLPEIELKPKVKHSIKKNLFANPEESEYCDVENEEIGIQENSNNETSNSIENDFLGINKNDENIQNQIIENEENLSQKIKNKSSKNSDTKIDFDFLEETKNDQTKEPKNDDLSDEEKIQNHIDSMTIIYNNFINFIEKADYDEKDYKQLLQIIKEQRIKENLLKLKEIFLMIIQISNYHYKTSFFFERIEKIILIFRDVYKKKFTNFELFNIFVKSKNILLILIKQKLLVVDQQIANVISNSNYLNQKYHFYFYPEIKQFIDETLKKKVEQLINKNIGTFKQKRQNGINDDFLCELIRDDKIAIFFNELQSRKLHLDSFITPSEFETDIFLLNGSPTFIQYAAFYGSIQIFKYYIDRKKDIDPILWIYAIHGNRFDIIHLLEQKRIKPNILNCLKESIKCHHNEMTNYFLNRFGDVDVLRLGIKYHNFAFISNMENIVNCFKNLCKNYHPIIVDILLNSENEEIEQKIVFF